MERAVHGVQIVFLIRHWKSIIFVFYPYLSWQRFLVKCLMTLGTTINANKQVTKNIFYVDRRNSSHNRKPEFVLKTEVCVCHNKRCARARVIECDVTSLILETILQKNASLPVKHYEPAL